MKKLILVACTLLVYNYAFTQRTLEWSIGEPQVTCGATVQVCYPLLVSINDANNSPSLGTSTMRIFYDGNILTNFEIKNIENGYSDSGLNQSAPVYGGVFGFSNEEGIFAQFNIIDNAAVSPIKLSTTATHVLDFCFDIADDATYPLCAPIVFDNNQSGWGGGKDLDCGYLVNDSGIVGAYFLDNNVTASFLADDEVVNYLWNTSQAFDGRVNAFNDKTGKTKKTEFNDCIQDVCGVSDCDEDGISDSEEMDENENGIPDDCEDDIVIGEFETAFARGDNNATCFLEDGFNRWGWTNYFEEENTYELNLYAAAGQCNIGVGKWVGKVMVNYNNDQVDIVYKLFDGYVMTEAHVYVGCASYPLKNNRYTVAPGQYTYKTQGNLNNIAMYTVGSIDVSELTNGIYVIAHAVVSKKSDSSDIGETYTPTDNIVSCITDNDNIDDFSGNRSLFKVYPVPFDQKVYIKYLFEYDTDVTIEIFDAKKTLIKQIKNSNIGYGYEEEIDLSRIDIQVLFVRLTTDRSVSTKKIVSVPK